MVQFLAFRRIRLLPGLRPSGYTASYGVNIGGIGELQVNRHQQGNLLLESIASIFLRMLRGVELSGWASPARVRPPARWRKGFAFRHIKSCDLLPIVYRFQADGIEQSCDKITVSWPKETVMNGYSEKSRQAWTAHSVRLIAPRPRLPKRRFTTCRRSAISARCPLTLFTLCVHCAVVV